ncbi:SLATT domain-containing protein, partial [Streptomyces sp. NPDC096095]|uniref:SLATT domain-containing protein n=1 Tax=Streptomyces sp. NPDC096095 TaxID=3155545 RepID=UPI00331B3D78
MCRLDSLTWGRRHRRPHLPRLSLRLHPADPVGHGAVTGRGCLLLGAACMACDRYFGLTSGWIRNLATAQ